MSRKCPGGTSREVGQRLPMKHNVLFRARLARTAFKEVSDSALGERSRTWTKLGCGLSGEPFP
jgi:hypothetical protein